MIRKNVKLKELNRSEIYRYLGYKNTPDDIVRGIIDECEDKIISILTGAYSWDIFDIAESKDGVEVLNTELVLTGQSIKTHLTGCKKVVLLCATLGVEADKLIRQMEFKDMAKALVLDTAASVAIEQICDEAEHEIKSNFNNWYMTYRFGVGYGDLSLNYEHIILDILSAGKHIGLYSSENDTLIPRKSVVCIIGLCDKPLQKGQKGCITCNMMDRCSFRKQGLKCS